MRFLRRAAAFVALLIVALFAKDAPKGCSDPSASVLQPPEQFKR